MAHRRPSARDGAGPRKPDPFDRKDADDHVTDRTTGLSGIDNAENGAGEKKVPFVRTREGRRLAAGIGAWTLFSVAAVAYAVAFVRLDDPLPDRLLHRHSAQENYIEEGFLETGGNAEGAGGMAGVDTSVSGWHAQQAQPSGSGAVGRAASRRELTKSGDVAGPTAPWGTQQARDGMSLLSQPVPTLARSPSVRGNWTLPGALLGSVVQAVLPAQAGHVLVISAVEDVNSGGNVPSGNQRPIQYGAHMLTWPGLGWIWSAALATVEPHNNTVQPLTMRHSSGTVVRQWTTTRLAGDAAPSADTPMGLMVMLSPQTDYYDDDSHNTFATSSILRFEFTAAAPMHSRRGVAPVTDRTYWVNAATMHDLGRADDSSSSYDDYAPETALEQGLVRDPGTGLWLATTSALRYIDATCSRSLALPYYNSTFVMVDLWQNETSVRYPLLPEVQGWPGYCWNLNIDVIVDMDPSLNLPASVGIASVANPIQPYCTYSMDDDQVVHRNATAALLREMCTNMPDSDVPTFVYVDMTTGKQMGYTKVAFTGGSGSILATVGSGKLGVVYALASSFGGSAQTAVLCIELSTGDILWAAPISNIDTVLRKKLAGMVLSADGSKLFILSTFNIDEHQGSGSPSYNDDNTNDAGSAANPLSAKKEKVVLLLWMTVTLDAGNAKTKGVVSPAETVGNSKWISKNVRGGSSSDVMEGAHLAFMDQQDYAIYVVPNSYEVLKLSLNKQTNIWHTQIKQGFDSLGYTGSEGAIGLVQGPNVIVLDEEHRSSLDKIALILSLVHGSIAFCIIVVRRGAGSTEEGYVSMDGGGGDARCCLHLNHVLAILGAFVMLGQLVIAGVAQADAGRQMHNLTKTISDVPEFRKNHLENACGSTTSPVQPPSAAELTEMCYCKGLYWKNPPLTDAICARPGNYDDASRLMATGSIADDDYGFDDAHNGENCNAILENWCDCDVALQAFTCTYVLNNDGTCTSTYVANAKSTVPELETAIHACGGHYTSLARLLWAELGLHIVLALISNGFSLWRAFAPEDKAVLAAKPMSNCCSHVISIIVWAIAYAIYNKGNVCTNPGTESAKLLTRGIPGCKWVPGTNWVSTEHTMLETVRTAVFVHINKPIMFIVVALSGMFEICIQ